MMRVSWRVVTGVAVSMLFFLAGTTSATSAPSAPGSNAVGWQFSGGNAQNTRWAEQEHVISPATVSNLHVNWKFATAGAVRATPAVDGTSAYFPDEAGYLHRVDTKTGQALWTIYLPTTLGLPAGATSVATPAVVGNQVIFGIRNNAFAPYPVVVASVDKSSGRLLWQTKMDNHPEATITQSPLVVGDKVFIGVSSDEETVATFPTYPCCSFRGSMMALDLRTGAILWKTYTVPPDYSGGAVWSNQPVFDVKRNSVYFTTGNDYTSPPAVVQCVAEHQGDPTAIDACQDPRNFFDSILALNPDTGAVKWGRRLQGYDTFTGACEVPQLGAFCPTPSGSDYDFGEGVSLFHISGPGGGRDIIGAGQKSGVYFALDPDDGSLVWSQVLGPGGENGGMEYGSAVDNNFIYVAEADAAQVNHVPPFYTLPSGQVIDYGSVAALDRATGRIVWQVPSPVGTVPCSAGSPVTCGGYHTAPTTVANGVVFNCARDEFGHMFAFDAATGRLLWSFASGGSCSAAGAAVVSGTVYWGASGASPGLYSFGV